MAPRSKRAGRKRPPLPNDLPPKQALARQRALEALSDMRTKGWSLTRAAREAETTPRNVQKYARRALKTTEGGRYTPTPFDRMPRAVRLLKPDGIEVVVVRDSRTASKVGRYWNAVDRHLKTGDPAELSKFRGKSFQVHGIPHEFLTDADTIEALANVGEVAFEEMYALSI